jgi:hypothetical protein
MESSESTDERIYKCSACDGTRKIADRRKPDPALQETVTLLRNARLILSDHGQVDGDNCEECREMVAEINAYLGDQ